MNILDVHLVSADLEGQRRFYREVLELPTSLDGPLSVQVGQTRLSFEAGAGLPGPYHLAFDVPEHRFGEALRWLRSRVTLLGEGGQDHFASAAWNARMAYFADAEGNILELIARHALPRPASPRLLLNVSEVGLAVPDVPAALQALQEALGIGPYLEPSATFTPAGTPEGLFILVPPGRPWFPTARAAAPLLVRVLARTPLAGQVTLGPVQITGITDP